MKRLGFFQGHLSMDSKSLALFTPSKPMCNLLFLTPSKPVCNLLFLTPSKPVCNLLFLTRSKPVWLYEGHWWWMLTGLGFKVFAACLTSEGANKLQEACSDRVTTLLLDVTEEKSIAAARHFVESGLPAGTGQTHQSVSQCFVLCLFIIASWIASRPRSDPQSFIAFKVHGTVIFWRAPVAQYLRLQPSMFSVRVTSPLAPGPYILPWEHRGDCFPGIPPRSYGL